MVGPKPPETYYNVEIKFANGKDIMLTNVERPTLHVPADMASITSRDGLCTRHIPMRNVNMITITEIASHAPA